MLMREAFPDMPIHLSVQANAVNWATVKFWRQHGPDAVSSSPASCRWTRSRRSACRCRTWSWKSSSTARCAWPTPAAACSPATSTSATPTRAPAPTPAAGSTRCTRARKTSVGQHRPPPASPSPCRRWIRPWARASRPMPWCCSEESNRPGEFMSAFEDEHGTYIMNSKDLRAVQHVERLTRMGVHSLKIEGRTKSHYYVRAHRPGLPQGHRRRGGRPAVRSDPDGHPREPGPPRLHRGLPAPPRPRASTRTTSTATPLSERQQFVGEFTGVTPRRAGRGAR